MGFFELLTLNNSTKTIQTLVNKTSAGTLYKLEYEDRMGPLLNGTLYCLNL